MKNETGNRVMKSLLRALALGVGPLVVAAVVAKSLQGSIVVDSLESASVISERCSTPPSFKTLDEEWKRNVLQLGDGFKFYGNSWLGADICSKGILEVQVRGELGGDEEPVLNVVIENIGSEKFYISKSVNVKVSIPSPSKVYLGYTNDYIVVDTRIAYIRNVNLFGINCNGFKNVDAPQDSGGRWNSRMNAGQVLSRIPLTFSPCSSGKLSFETNGREGKNVFPNLVIKQSGKIVETAVSDSVWRTIDVDINDSPFEIFVSNPYVDTKIDRNLVIEQINFSEE